MPRTHRVMEGRRQLGTTPTVFYRCFSVYFCFLSGRIKYFSMSPTDIIVLSPESQAQHKIGCTGASQPPRIILEGLKIPKSTPWEMLPHSHAWPG